jgi:uncharacterized protein with FMN-binding domain
MKKVLISIAAIALFAIYSVYAATTKRPSTVAASTTQTNNTTTTATPSTTTTASTTPATTGTYKDGTYTGKNTNAFYGYIQVKITVSGGKLTDVAFLEYPDDQRESIQISEAATPLLKQEAIKAQTAKVDNISGATQTSDAFIESLSSALDQAKA